MRTKGTITEMRIACLVVLFLVSMTFLIGCKTMKSIESSNVEWSSRDSSYLKSGGRTDSSWYQHLLTDTSWWSHIGHIIIYDTSAPKDSATGQHPIQAEIDYTEEHHNAITQRTDCTRVVYDTLREQVVVRDSTYEKSVYKVVTSYKTPWYARWQFVLILLITSFLLGGYTAWKIK